MNGLVDLQAHDLLVHRLKKRLQEIPAAVKKLEDDARREEETLAELDRKFKHEEVTQKEKELEIRSGEDEIKKLQKRLMEVKTNKEYTALIHEIDSTKVKISQLEEEALRLMDSVQDFRRRREEVRKTLDKKKGTIQAAIEALREEETAARQALEAEEKKRPVLASVVSRETLRTYEQVLNKKADRKALAAVKGGVCKGCQMRLPTVTIDQLHKGTELIICENCSRILYLEE